MSNVINMFDYKKKQAKESKDTAGYNFAEVMKKNAERERRQKEERKQSTQDLANTL